MTISLLSTALRFDCPTCGTQAGKHCVTNRLCLSRLHLATKQPEIIRAAVLNMYSASYTPNTHNYA